MHGLPGWSGRWRRVGSEAGLRVGSRGFDCHCWLVTDDPYEGSGLAWCAGLARLQHMNGGRWLALATWDRGRGACCPAVPPELADAR